MVVLLFVLPFGFVGQEKHGWAIFLDARVPLSVSGTEPKPKTSKAQASMYTPVPVAVYRFVSFEYANVYF
nr:hypothetical protein BaRGS_008570 [Batillaria attramentaria]